MNKWIIFVLIFTIFSCQKPAEKNMVKLIFVLKITDKDSYKRYRDKIRPLMNNYSVSVLNEYTISEVLHSQSDEDQVNRLAVFEFKNETSKKQFFSDPIYLDAKEIFKISTSNFSKLIE